MSEPETSELPEWLSTLEACRLLGRTPATLKRLAQQGLIRVHRPGRAWATFYRTDVEKLAPPKINNTPNA